MEAMTEENDNKLPCVISGLANVEPRAMRPNRAQETTGETPPSQSMQLRAVAEEDLGRPISPPAAKAKPCAQHTAAH